MSDQCGIQVTGRRRKTQVTRIMGGEESVWMCVGFQLLGELIFDWDYD